MTYIESDEQEGELHSSGISLVVMVYYKIESMRYSYTNFYIILV